MLNINNLLTLKYSQTFVKHIHPIAISCAIRQLNVYQYIPCHHECVHGADFRSLRNSEFC